MQTTISGDTLRWTHAITTLMEIEVKKQGIVEMTINLSISFSTFYLIWSCRCYNKNTWRINFKIVFKQSMANESNKSTLLYFYTLLFVFKSNARHWLYFLFWQRWRQHPFNQTTYLLSKKNCMQKGRFQYSAYPNFNPAQKMHTFLHTNVSEKVLFTFLCWVVIRIRFFIERYISSWCTGKCKSAKVKKYGTLK